MSDAFGADEFSSRHFLFNEIDAVTSAGKLSIISPTFQRAHDKAQAASRQKKIS
jgi:hypothetical protein